MQRTGPSVAGVVVNHNYARYLARAIDSLLDQERHFAEVIVVDDGSTDESLSIAEGYGERVRVIAKANGGQLSACLEGLRTATSDYVYFLDADDVALPPLVSRVADVLTRVLAGASEAPVKVQFQLRAVDGEEEPTGSVFPSYPHAYDSLGMRRDDVVAGNHLTPPTSGNVYHRETLLAMDWDLVDLRDFVDGPITSALPYLGEVAVIQEPLALYRVHGDNHSQWFAPTPELLHGEVTWFEDRWHQTCALLGRTEPPFAGATPVYVLERELLIGALEGRPWLVGPATAYSRGVRRTQAPRTSVLALQLWALALALPVPALRRHLVHQRRAAAERPWLVRAMIALIRRSRT